MDVDTNASRGEQVTYHYLSGAVTNYEKTTLSWENLKRIEDST